MADCAARNRFREMQFIPNHASTLGDPLPPRETRMRAVAFSAWSSASVNLARCRPASRVGIRRRGTVATAAGRGPWPLSARGTAHHELPKLQDPLTSVDDHKLWYPEDGAHMEWCNWIIPDRVILGRFPYIEPSRCPDPEMGEKHLRALVDHRVTTFVCLQDELGPQTAMTDPVAHGGGLFHPYLPRVKELADYEPLFLFEGIVDKDVPTLDRLVATVARCHELVERGERLYIHCWGGRGRAGTVGACLLASMYRDQGMTGEEVLLRVQKAYDAREDDDRKSPETEAQRDLIRRFVAQLV